MNATTTFAILGLISALAYIGNPFSDNNYSENKPIQGGGKKSRKIVNKGNHKSRKH